MYCKNCGQQLEENAAFCVHCGVAKGSGNKFCPSCGKETAEGAVVCVNCGVALSPAYQSAVNASEAERKSKLVVGLLGIFLGAFGIHNFYLGYTKKAVIQLLVSLLTCGIGATVMEIWGLIEGIFYLMGKEGYTTDANGIPLKE